MDLLCYFSIGAGRILSKNHSTEATVTKVSNSFLHTVKKPMRLYTNERNTLFSHSVTFTYQVDNILYSGKLFVDLKYDTPRVGNTFPVYYDPDKPWKYAAYPFPICTGRIGW